ncbi:DUF416 family protein [Chamaesiphon polymorphus]|uniref:DUF416 domain-containing protein n=1 Tax=Chamaesiphon polymorphus CCALA 037 TaxID=2107692 RepID=A0A2T1G9I7_9CYAN|nr:DUF416 family protein [Chamaesiphon polymorphus]PSB53860.1 hypothetical protein C7B77_19225 [Chamaesiphon polymorphus CCALA 037]
MVLTVEKVLEREKSLSGFTPFVEIAVELKKMPFIHQIAFFCSCYERILPTYSLVDGHYGWEELSVFQSVLNDLWQLLCELEINEETISALIDRSIEISIEDEDEIEDYWESRNGNLYGNIAETILSFIDVLLKYIQIKDIDSYLNIFVKIIFVIYEYLGMYLENTDPEQFLEKTRYEIDLIILNHVLIQKELQKELADLEFLKSVTEINPIIISTFRASSCTDSVGILGSLEEVRANLE